MFCEHNPSYTTTEINPRAWYQRIRGGLEIGPSPDITPFDFFPWG